MWLWVMKNKVVIVLVLVVGYLVWKQNVGVTPLSVMRGATNYESADVAGLAPMMVKTRGDVVPSTSTNRLVVTDTNLSLVVKQAGEAIEAIKRIATGAGGFMVDTYVSSPQENASGNITIRVPSKNLDQVLAAIRAVGLRVTNEQVVGTDVTDQYEDLGARLAVLEQTKRKFEEIMERATQVQDILNVQREIISVQSQIDSLKGRQQYLAKTAELAKVTVYVSTDEYSLPYAPSEPWRPDVVFKLAVRSLVVHMRSLGSAIIWLVVYAVVWVPVVGVVWWWKKRGSRA